MGIICRHCIKVLIHTNKSVVSSYYIMDRWRKGIKRIHNALKNCYLDNMSNDHMSRHNELYSKFSYVVDAAVVSEEKYVFCTQYMDSLQESLLHFSSANANCSSVGVTPSPVRCVHSPKKVRSKGRPPTKRKAAKVYRPKTKHVKNT
ncbi:hypothetical protein QJS04_geneDACA016287 [Acorus gramineus]|uniref:Protein FAR1-RELATED SEQUENCE n=1 Tax=Acorus gramineus TaxID=55184 RepID=A0AAV8ZYT9_ACOGR|nr:hypothetical protein QJS04_geneDACA016287 [Acorus gramineus]